MAVSEADTVVAALVNQGIPTTTLASTSLEVSSVPPLSVFPSIWPASVWPERKAGSIKSNAPTEHMQDVEQGKTDGCLARTNTVTTCGKAEAVHGSLDVAACFSRLQGELRKDEELERKEVEAEELARREAEEIEQEKRQIVDKRWAERPRENRMRAAEKATSIDGRLMGFLHCPEIMDHIVVGASTGAGESRAGATPGGNFPLDTITHSATSNGGEKLPVEPSVPENLREPSVLPIFEWGVGPAPGEEKYSSKNPKSARASGCCVVS